jgi:hypothetical protein
MSSLNTVELSSYSPIDISTSLNGDTTELKAYLENNTSSKWEIKNNIVNQFIDCRRILLELDYEGICERFTAFMISESTFSEFLQNYNGSKQGQFFQGLMKIYEFYYKYRVRLLKDIATFLLDKYNAQKSEVRIIINFLKNRLGTNEILDKAINQSLTTLNEVIQRGEEKLKSLTEENENNIKENQPNSSLTDQKSNKYLVKLEIGKKINQAKTWNRIKYRDQYILNQFKKRHTMNQNQNPESTIQKIEEFKKKKLLKTGIKPKSETVFSTSINDMFKIDFRKSTEN